MDDVDRKEKWFHHYVPFTDWQRKERASERTMCVWKNIEIGITEKANFVKPKDGTK